MIQRSRLVSVCRRRIVTVSGRRGGLRSVRGRHTSRANCCTFAGFTPYLVCLDFWQMKRSYHPVQSWRGPWVPLHPPPPTALCWLQPRVLLFRRSVCWTVGGSIGQTRTRLEVHFSLTSTRGCPSFTLQFIHSSTLLPSCCLHASEIRDLLLTFQTKIHMLHVHICTLYWFTWENTLFMICHTIF